SSPRHLLSHPNGVSELRIAPDGETLLVAAHDMVHLYDLSTGRPVSPPLLHPDPVTAAAFCGSRVVTASFSEKTNLTTLKAWTVSDDSHVTDGALAGLARLVGGGALVGGRIEPLSEEQTRAVWASLPVGVLKNLEAPR